MAIEFLYANLVPGKWNDYLQDNINAIKMQGEIKVTTDFIYTILHKIKEQGYEHEFEYDIGKTVVLDMYIEGPENTIPIKNSQILQIIQVLGFLSHPYHQYIEYLVTDLRENARVLEEKVPHTRHSLKYFSVRTLEYVFRSMVMQVRREATKQRRQEKSTR
jgi:hypothetical protein